MRILMVNDYKHPIAGTEVYVENISRELKNRGYEVLFYASATTSKEYYSPTYNKSFASYIQRIFSLKHFLQFRKVVKEFKPDIIHIHNIYNEISPSILLNLKCKKIVMTVHDARIISPVSIQTLRTGKKCKEEVCKGCMNCIGIKGVIYEIPKRLVQKILFKKINLFITPSVYLKNVLESKNIQPVINIPNGIPLLEYSKINLYNAVLYIGRLSEEKGVSILIDSISLVKKKIPSISLTILGEGDEKSILQNKVKELNLDNNIKFVGSVNSKSISKYFENSSIVVIPSIYPDNFPTVCIEAISVGRPLIGSRIGGIPELIDDGVTGYLVKPSDSNELSEKIVKLLSNKELIEKMSKDALQKSKAYTIESHVDKIEKIYKTV